MHQLWNYVKSTIISHFHTNCKFSPNLMMHTKRKCKCSKIVDPTAIKIIQMCWLIVCCVGVDQTYPREENADGNSALERVGPDQMFIKASILYPCQYLLFLFPLFLVHALINIKVNVKSNVEIALFLFLFITLNILRPSPSSFSPSNEISEVNF